ncbi:MAG: hypothetical protein RR198_07660, partial [Oscillospiraceae bacterium]
MKKNNKNYKGEKITDTQKVKTQNSLRNATYDDMLNEQFEQTVATVVKSETYPQGAENREGKCPDELRECVGDEEENRQEELQNALYNREVLCEEALYDCLGTAQKSKFQFMDNLNSPNVENSYLKKNNNKKVFKAAQSTQNNGEDGLSDVTNFYSFAENSVA